MLKDFDTDQAELNGPDVTITDNNGLLFTADMLELVYTDKEFPKQAPALAESMKDSGKSRADLWAFAALVAVQWGGNANNLACQVPYMSTGKKLLCIGHPKYRFFLNTGIRYFTVLQIQYRN